MPIRNEKERKQYNARASNVRKKTAKLEQKLKKLMMAEKKIRDKKNRIAYKYANMSVQTKDRTKKIIIQSMSDKASSNFRYQLDLNFEKQKIVKRQIQDERMRL